MSLQEFSSQLQNVNQRLAQRLSNFNTSQQTAQDIKSELITEDIDLQKLKVSKIKSIEEIGTEIVGGGIGIAQLSQSKLGQALGGKIKNFLGKKIKERIQPQEEEDTAIDEPAEEISMEEGQDEIDNMFSEMGEDPNIETIQMNDLPNEDDFQDALEEQPPAEIEETSFGEIGDETEPLLSSTAEEGAIAETSEVAGAEVAAETSVGILGTLGGVAGVGLGLATLGMGIYSAIETEKTEDEIDDKYKELQTEYNDLNTHPIFQTGTLSMPVYDSTKFRQGITHF